MLAYLIVSWMCTVVIVFDALRRPESAWLAADRSRAGWLAYMIPAGFFGLGPFCLVIYGVGVVGRMNGGGEARRQPSSAPPVPAASLASPGRPFLPASDAEPPRPQAAQASPACVGCRHPLGPEDQFCGSCGTPVAVGPAVCRNCGDVLHDADRFCTGCGTGVEPEARRE